MCGEGHIGFAVHFLSESELNRLIFQIDGQPVGAWSGAHAWTEVMYPISTGMHTFEWIYEVDPADSEAPGAAWIDDIAVTVYGDETNVLTEVVPANLLENFISASNTLESLVPEFDTNLENKLNEEIATLSNYIELQINSAQLSQDEINQIHTIVNEVEDHWCDLYGFVLLNYHDKHVYHDEEGRVLRSDNPVLFTAEYLQLLEWLGVLEGDLKAWYKAKTKAMIDLLRVAPGVFNRWPNHDEHAFSEYFSHDEQQGLLMLDHIFDHELGYAIELNEYGKKNLYCYDNIKYSPFDPPVEPVDLSEYKIPVTIPADITSVVSSAIIPARQPPFIELIRLTAGEEPLLLNQEWQVWSLRISTLLPKEDTSSKILNFHEIPLIYQAIRDSNTSAIIKLRSLKAMKDFYDSMAMMYKSDNHPLHEIHKIYYSQGNHPIRRLSSYLNIENARIPQGQYDLDCTMTCDKDCTGQCDRDCSSRCTKELFGVSIVDPVCMVECRLEELTCEAGCVIDEKKCEATCALIEDALGL